MLFKIIGDLKPEYLIVCFDKKAPTFRKQMYVGYQAKRPTMSDDLVPQIELVHKALDCAQVQHFEIDGYEADDLIGTIAKEAVEKEVQVIILSGDRDLLQLINSHVLMLAPIVGITKMTLFDETKVKEKYGSLRFYTNYSDDFVDRLINEAEINSEVTCEECGNPGVLRNDCNWYTTLCELHAIRDGKRIPTAKES